MKKYLIDQDQMTYLLQILECYPMMRDELDRIKPVEPQEEIDDLKYELSVAREAQQCECSSDDACRFARERDALKADYDKLKAELEALRNKGKSFGQMHPRNPHATCKCEHWQSCAECHPTAHAEEKTE